MTEKESKTISEKEAAQLYELAYHIVPTVPEKGLEAAVAAVRGLVEKAGGKLVSEEFPKQFTLSYTISKHIQNSIKKFDTSYFGWMVFESASETMTELQKELNLSENILRAIIIKTVGDAGKREPVRKPMFKKPTAEEISKKVKEPKEEKKEVVEEELDKEIEKMVGADQSVERSS